MRQVIETPARPRGLREPRPGYFTYVKPNGESMAIGRVPLTVAIAEAEAANAYIVRNQPSLVARLMGADNTMETLLAKMPVPENANTARQRRAQDKVLREALGSISCTALTVADCAAVVEGIADEGHATMAAAVRSRLIEVCRRGMQLGWMPGNPADATGRPKVEVQRGRLVLDTFCAIYDAAPRIAAYLQPAMKLALVSGVDRVTLVGLTKANVADGHLTFQRRKTKRWIKVPLSLRLDKFGWSLADAVNPNTGVISPNLIHHIDVYGETPAGTAVYHDTLTAAFTAARKLAGIPDVLPDGKTAPTFHEIRSLCKRLYDDQGGVDTLALLGHADEKTGGIYADGRGVEPVMVRVA